MIFHYLPASIETDFPQHRHILFIIYSLYAHLLPDAHFAIIHSRLRLSATENITATTRFLDARRVSRIDEAILLFSKMNNAALDITPTCFYCSWLTQYAAILYGHFEQHYHSGFHFYFYSYAAIEMPIFAAARLKRNGTSLSFGRALSIASLARRLHIFDDADTILSTQSRATYAE